jgi:hypothetical protein
MRKAPYTDTELFGIAEECHMAFEAALATEVEEPDEHGVCPKRDKHFDEAIARLRALVDEAYCAGKSGHEWES